MVLENWQPIYRDFKQNNDHTYDQECRQKLYGRSMSGLLWEFGGFCWIVFVDFAVAVYIFHFSPRKNEPYKNNIACPFPKRCVQKIENTHTLSTSLYKLFYVCNTIHNFRTCRGVHEFCMHINPRESCFNNNNHTYMFGYRVSCVYESVLQR